MTGIIFFITIILSRTIRKVETKKVMFEHKMQFKWCANTKEKIDNEIW